MKRLIYTITAVTLFFTFLLSGCSFSPSTEPVTASAFCFDTVITIKIWDTDSQKLLDGCIQKCEEYEQKFSRTLEGSEIYQINHAGGEPVTVSEDTADLIRIGLYYSELSDGKFDITIAPLSILWDFKNNTGIVPDESAILEACSHINYKNVKLSGNTVVLTDPKAGIDLGGIAKGYIADELKSYLTDSGVQHATITLGGNVVTIGDKPDGTAFMIGIQKPFEEQNTVITSLEIKDQSVVSSGNYERYFEKDGKIYHHILNPKTGYPYDNHLYGVTIVSDYSVDGDALSTTCFAMGLEEGLTFVNQLDGIEAIFITDDYELHYSTGLKP